jgi:hypothetical protein
MPIDAKAEITVTLFAEEWNQVLDVLGDGRFKLVSPLIKKIVEQAQAQQNQGQEAAAQGLPRLQPVS